MLSFISFTALAALSLTFENAVLASARLLSLHNSTIENSYIVKLKDGANITSHINSLPFSFSVEDPNSPVTHWWPDDFRGYSGIFVGAALDAILVSPDVEYVEKNGVITATASQINAPWNLQAISTQVPVGGTDVNAMTYNYRYNLPVGDGVDIYIVDSGVNIRHNEFEGRATFGWVAGGGPKVDDAGHGTHVAGIAAGRTYGVAKNANIIAVKIFFPGQRGHIADAIGGLAWVLANVGFTGRPSVVCLPFNGEHSQALNYQTELLINHRITVVVSAGNDNQDAAGYSPATARGVIVVGSSDITNAKSPTSNFGPLVNIFAPGVAITSAWITGPSSTMMGSGTSQAVAYVAGVAAYFLSQDPGLTPLGINTLILYHATQDAISGVLPGTVTSLLFNGVRP